MWNVETATETSDPLLSREKTPPVGETVVPDQKLTHHAMCSGREPICVAVRIRAFRQVSAR